MLSSQHPQLILARYFTQRKIYKKEVMVKYPELKIINL